MDLKTFVKTSLVEIIEGVIEAQEHFKEAGLGKLIRPTTDKRGKYLVEFDVAVTTTNEKGGKGGAGIKVMEIGVGGEINTRFGNENTSRVKFEVPITYPTAFTKKGETKI